MLQEIRGDIFTARTSNVFTKAEPEIKEQPNTEISKGIDDIENGRVYTVEEEMHRLYGI